MSPSSKLPPVALVAAGSFFTLVEAVGHTNEVIATQLSGESSISGVYCQDGQKRDLWKCDYAFITRLEKSRVALQLEFKVFNRYGKYGPVRPWTFLRKKRPLSITAALNKGLLRMGSSVAPPSRPAK